MNTLVIVLIAAVVLVCAYAGYGRWLAKTWGVDPNAKTPAVRLEENWWANTVQPLVGT